MCSHYNQQMTLYSAVPFQRLLERALYHALNRVGQFVIALTVPKFSCRIRHYHHPITKQASFWSTTHLACAQIGVIKTYHTLSIRCHFQGNIQQLPELEQSINCYRKGVICEKKRVGCFLNVFF